MGLRFRKSINLGAGFRVNLSKSGVGYSWGVKGYRVTKKANGGVRCTASIPGTGISYVEETGAERKPQQQPQGQQINGCNLTENTSASISTLTSANHSEFISKINKNGIISYLLFCLFFTAIFIQVACGVGTFGNPLDLIIGLALLAVEAVIIFFVSKTQIEIDYEIAADFEEILNLREQSLATLADVHKLWKETHSGRVQAKTNAGANKQIVRKEAKLSKARLPFFLKSESKYYQLKIANEKLVFLPDKVLIIKGLKKSAIDYKDLSVSVQYTKFIEEKAQTKDSELLGYTWLKVNKDGSPDKRFAGNRQLPQFKYGVLTLTTLSGFNLILLTSNFNKTLDFENKYNEMLKEMTM